VVTGVLAAERKDEGEKIRNVDQHNVWLGFMIYAAILLIVLRRHALFWLGMRLWVKIARCSKERRI